MYLVMAIEHFPDSEPVRSLHVREREADAVMLARCMRDEVKSCGHHAIISVHPCGDASTHYTVAARPRRRRRVG